MKNKVISLEEAMEFIHDGQTIMVGGFMTCGTPEILMDGILKKGATGLTGVCNDGGVPGKGIGKLIQAKLLKKLIATHIGLNPQVR